MAGDASEIKLFNALMRESFRHFTRKVFATVSPGSDYSHNWHIDMMCEYLQAVMDGDMRRLIINIPPRYMKSITVSIAFPAFVMGHNPSKQILAASYASDLSLELSTATRLVCESAWYRRAFPQFKMAKDQNTKGQFKTTQRGYRVATSVGTSRIGFGGDYLIVDDPIDPKKVASKVQRESANDWFRQSFYTRQNNKKKSSIIVVMQRLHEKDLTGFLLEQDIWEHLKIPAIAEKKTIIDFRNVRIERPAGDILHPEREGEAEMEITKISLGSIGFASQYQQEPAPADGAIFKLSWFRRYKEPPEFIRFVQSWDTAYKEDQLNDPSVCTTWGEAINGFYLLDSYVARLGYPELKKKAMSLAAKWVPDAILIEDKASGQSLIQDLRNETALPIITILPEASKEVRASVVSPKVEAGRVWLPEKAPWLHDYETEMTIFPNAEHDDQVDSTTQFLGWITTRERLSTPKIRSL